MRDCPKCGFHDPDCWRSYRWVTDIDRTRWDEFISEYPQFSSLKPGEKTEDEHYYYKRSNMRNHGLYISRWPKKYGPNYGNFRELERHKVSRAVKDGKQKKLSV
jgi:hypothetical protein